METEIISQLTQLGVAGLMGMLWIMERRYSSQRERQLTEAHTQLISKREQIAELVKVVTDNSVALNSLERVQAQLIGACEAIARELQQNRNS